MNKEKNYNSMLWLINSIAMNYHVVLVRMWRLQKLLDCCLFSKFAKANVELKFLELALWPTNKLKNNDKNTRIVPSSKVCKN